MSVQDDAVAGSDSFWEVDNYKRTVKRQEDGNRLCTDFMQLIQDRADIEKHYAKSLKAWNKKWLELIEKGPEYATMERAFKGALQEADSLADVHLKQKDRLMNEVHASVKQWRTDSYHKGMMGPCKETKALEDEFRKAQKGWSKKFAKVQKCKKDYHTACKLEKTALHQEQNAKGDSGVSADQMGKMAAKAEKCRKDVISTKEKYEAALRDINDANPKYMEDMTEVFNKSQDFEEKRLKFFKEMLFGVHNCVDPQSYHEIPQIYISCASSVESSDHQQNLKWWSSYHGVDMAMNWPNFEEYSPELNTISRKEKKGSSTHHGTEGITMTAMKKNNNPPAQAQQTQPASNHDAQATPPGPSTPQMTRSESPPAPIIEEVADIAHMNNNEKIEESSNPNPFGEDNEWDADYGGSEAVVDDGSTGVPVRALYDYDGQEEDELTFKAGDVFVKIKDKDEQGWCTGRKDTLVGLYPENYCEPV